LQIIVSELQETENALVKLWIGREILPRKLLTNGC